ncbi:MAG TPA: glycosyltransferase family 39 protein [Verrucomicrobiae bacterium]|nr:glycosyltransferase family 39 protein [Verrucomicrobiae bacterium]
MDWLQSFDASLFRFINRDLSNPLLDAVMPLFSSNPLFIPALGLLAIWILWKGDRHSRLCLVVTLAILTLGNLLVCGPLKDAINRPRPFVSIPEARVLIGRGGSGSMPSSHAFNWFAAATVVGVYYRRSRRILLPLAALVAFSRVYDGVHYPSDVAVAALLGAGFATLTVWGMERAWRQMGINWFPGWFSRSPSLTDGRAIPLTRSSTGDPTSDPQWMRLGYLVTGILLLFRWWYLASGKIDLSEDEAYQWLWSKHPALSYFSKPPMIAYTQWLGTHLWGDNVFGVRFFSPLITAIVSWLMLRFLAREVNARAGFWLVLIVNAVPMIAVGSMLMTIDPLNVLFWTAAMVTGWRAVRDDSTSAWCWTGLWMGLGFLSKYTGLFQWLGWAVFLACWPPARTQIRRPGIYLALLINALCTIPVIVWNAQHGWITVTHLANRGGLDHRWAPTMNFFWDFIATEPLLLNPVFFIALVWAAIALWRQRPRNALLVYLFGMGAPLFLFYTAYTFRARVQGNWIAPSVVPLFAMMVIFWEERFRSGARWIKPWLGAGMTLGLLAAVLLHEPNFVAKVSGRPLPVKYEPLRRVRGWQAMGRVVEEARVKLATEGATFIIGGHYGITGLLSFYIPEAKATVKSRPLVYYQSTDHPANQFYFWPGYRERKGENAIYVQRVESPQEPPEELRREFTSVTDLGMRDVLYRGRVYHTVQLFECRGLR